MIVPTCKLLLTSLMLLLTFQSISYADFYVIPIAKKNACTGTLTGTRWCDNGDGTVKDLTTGLIWLKNSNRLGIKPFKINSINDNDDAHTAAGLLYDGSTSYSGSDCGLSDGSIVGDWRMSTKSELVALISGTDIVLSDSPQAFSNVQNAYYLSSTTKVNSTENVWLIHFGSGALASGDKLTGFHVWPVRSEQ